MDLNRHKCQVCDHEYDEGAKDKHGLPMYTDKVPTCPKCWNAFLLKVGHGYITLRKLYDKKD